MSANNIIFIKRKTNEVYYQPSCADNVELGELIGKGKNLDKAVDIAQKHIREIGGYLEYGITFI